MTKAAPTRRRRATELVPPAPPPPLRPMSLSGGWDSRRSFPWAARVGRHLPVCGRAVLLAAPLSLSESAAELDRRSTLEVSEGERDAAVAAVGRAESEKSAWFWFIGSNWPLHNAQPFGAKLKLMILISGKNRSAKASSF